jgi:hypothetical protein
MQELVHDRAEKGSNAFLVLGLASRQYGTRAVIVTTASRLHRESAVKAGTSFILRFEIYTDVARFRRN